jgi:hypothetical protein
VVLSLSDLYVKALLFQMVKFVFKRLCATSNKTMNIGEWPPSEREVLAVAFLRACSRKHKGGVKQPAPYLSKVLSHSLNVFSQVMLKMSLHVAKKGINKASTAPIPRRLYASIPVTVLYRKQVWAHVYVCASRVIAKPQNLFPVHVHLCIVRVS